MLGEQLDLVIFNRDGLWHGQFLQYDIGAQAETLEDLYYELALALVGIIAICEENGVELRDQRPPAPQAFWDLHKRAKRLDYQPPPGFRTPIGVPEMPKIAAWLADALLGSEDPVPEMG